MQHHKIMWLASYPKSGNTWMRAFLSALLGDGAVDLNHMKSDGIFSSRAIFDSITDLDSRYLYDEEAKSMLANVYRQLAKSRAQLNIIKVHDAYENDIYNKPIIPADVTFCAIYIIRNPLDIAGSLSGHMKMPIQDAVDMLLNPDSSIAQQPNNRNKSNQFRQHLSDWSGHVEGWTNNIPFPVYVVRYEDMLNNSIPTFSELLHKIDWNYPKETIMQAIAATNFDTLRNQEETRGFAEMDIPGARFFRAGKTGNWKNELTSAQITAITTKHWRVMEQYNYLP